MQFSQQPSKDFFGTRNWICHPNGTSGTETLHDYTCRYSKFFIRERLPAFSGFVDRFWGNFEPRRWFLWTPVFLALGAVTYFQLDKEPPLAETILLGGVTVLGLVLLRSFFQHNLQCSASLRGAGPTIVLFFVNVAIAFVVGFISANLRTVTVATPALEQSFECATYRGVVLDLEDVPRGTLKRPRLMRRLTLHQIEILASTAMPQKGKPSPIDITAQPTVTFPPCLKVRIQGPYPRLKKVRLGDRLTVQGSLRPPPFPLTLHGYDAPFDLYFKKISGIGKVAAFISCEPTVLKSPFLKKVRNLLSDAIRQRMESSIAPLATALTTGDRSGLTLHLREHFARAGLSHTLAISGLHMGLVAGLVFWVLLRILACIPPLATRFVVKKIAAMLTIPIAFAYLLLSGASFSAIRAFIMVSMAMFAILLDQRPVSLRCTAAAASVILILFPESIYSVSFQLSFASVTGLCYAYESGNWTRWLSARAARSLSGRVPAPVKPLETYSHRLFKYFQRILRSYAFQGLFKIMRRGLCLLEQSVLTTLIATLATTPITLFVFQRMTLVGMLGNLLAVPILSFCVIPLALLSVLSLTFGGSPLMFELWEASLRLLSEVATFVANLPGSYLLLRRPACTSLIMFTFAALWLMIWRENKRRLAIPVFLLSLTMFALSCPPDLFIAQNGQVIGIQDGSTFWISSLRWGSFHAKVWSQECGVEDVQPLPYHAIEVWKKALKPWTSFYPDDVVFLWCRPGYPPRIQVTPFTKKHRPWYNAEFK